MNGIGRSMTGIYKITDLTNGKVYVGSSICIEKRFSLHKSALRRNIGDCVLLQEVYNSHPNMDDFRFEVIEIFPDDIDRGLLFDREDYWMNVLKSRDPSFGYNLSKARQSGEHMAPIDGDNNPNFGRHHTDSERSKMKAAWAEERKAALRDRNRKRWEQYRSDNGVSSSR